MATWQPTADEANLRASMIPLIKAYSRDQDEWSNFRTWCLESEACRHLCSTYSWRSPVRQAPVGSSNVRGALLLSIREQVAAPDEASQSENSAATGIAIDELVNCFPTWLIEAVGSKTNPPKKVLGGRQTILGLCESIVSPMVQEWRPHRF